MIKEIVKDVLFLEQKSEPATKEEPKKKTAKKVTKDAE